eukprot:Nitzschia sp. Nitz4//scaffold33_size148984//121382//122209//NITZ4_002945-RA/size148984-processed-gene-0.178-mRNA-1//-1//CDS//3329548478//4933//frame0
MGKMSMLQANPGFEQSLLNRLTAPPPQPLGWEREVGRGVVFEFDEYKLPIINSSGENDQVVIKEDTSMIATRVWDCAVATAKWIEHRSSCDGIPNLAKALNLQVDPSTDQRPVQVLELGAGTGLLSVCLAKMGAAVLSTEYGVAVDHLRSSCDRNLVLTSGTLLRGKVKCRELDWYSASDSLSSLFLPGEEACFDMIVVTDCSLEGCHSEGVFDMIKKYGSKGHTRVVAGVCREREGTPLFLKLAREFRDFALIPSANLHPDYRTERQLIMTFSL